MSTNMSSFKKLTVPWFRTEDYPLLPDTKSWCRRAIFRCINFLVFPNKEKFLFSIQLCCKKSLVCIGRKILIRCLNLLLRHLVRYSPWKKETERFEKQGKNLRKRKTNQSDKYKKSQSPDIEKLGIVDKNYLCSLLRSKFVITFLNPRTRISMIVANYFQTVSHLYFYLHLYIFSFRIIYQRIMMLYVKNYSKHDYSCYCGLSNSSRINV